MVKSHLRMALLLTGLTGCAVGPDFQTPPPDVPAAFSRAAVDARTIDPSQWWLTLGDDQLNGLVDQAIKANLDLEMALTRIGVAQAREAVLLGAALPQADAAAGAGNGTGSDLTRGRIPSPLTSGDSTARTKVIHQVAGFDAGWELDFFGRLRRAIEAGAYDTQAAVEARNQVLITVIADVVQAYVDLQGTQMRMVLLRRNIPLARQSRDFIQMRYERGLTNELDLALAERQLAELKSEEAPLQAQIEAGRDAIAILLGQYPEQLAPDMAASAGIAVLPQSINPGIPLELIQRRPDIRQAQWELAAATARVGIATANLFPRISLVGAVGEQSGSISAGQASHLWSLGPSAYWPLLDFGSLDAQIDVADQQTHLQLLQYKRTIILAVRDVDVAISDFAAQQSRVKNLKDALDQSVRATALATARYDQGLTDFLNVVDAERQLYAIQDQYVSARQSAEDTFVSVFRSLGGGWEGYQRMPPAQRPKPALEAMFERL